MSREEFKKLFDSNFDAVRSYVYYRCGDSELATDIAQEVFMKLWEKSPGDSSNLKGLLYKMAGDLFVSTHRRREVERRYRDRLEFNYLQDSPEETAEYLEMQERYEKCLMEMNEGQRVVFLMSRVEELKYGEIAERLNIGVKAVEKRMSLALQFLREALGIEKNER